MMAMVDDMVCRRMGIGMFAEDLEEKTLGNSNIFVARGV